MKQVTSIDALVHAIESLEKAEMNLSGDVLYLDDESRFITQNMIALHLYISQGKYKPVFKVETEKGNINLYHVSPNKEKALVTSNFEPILNAITIHEFIDSEDGDYHVLHLQKLDNYLFQSFLQLIREAFDCFYQDEQMNNQPVIVFEGGLL